jgi:predicted LPLAT superfamily acyltransferase
MTGDIVWRNDQRRVEVSFLGGRAWLPEAPYIFAMVSGVPLFAFFAVRSGRNAYHITLSEPITVKSASRKTRSAAIQLAAQQYADLLEQALREHPFEWYHFDRFVH